MAGFRSRSESQRSQKSQKSQPRRGQDGGRAKGYQQRRPQERQEKPKLRGSGDAVRDVALSVLRQVTEEDAYANLVAPQAIRRAGLKGRDAAFATELIYGSLRATGLLDAVIALAAGREVEKIDSMALDILRLGTYQILRTRVEDHAAVDTSVNLAKAFGAQRASGFINGVLRTVTRTPAEDWVARVAGGSNIADVSLRHAHPAWIGEVFNESLGGSSTSIAPDLEEALTADDARPIVHLAARPGLMSAEELALVSGGTEGRFSPYAVYVDDGAPRDLDPIKEKLASVQDEGSQLIALTLVRAALDKQDSGRWLDLCAGPGGKTAFIGSWAVGEEAAVDAVEITPHRATLISQALDADMPVTVHVGDGRTLQDIDSLDYPDGGFDRILVDAPCSGLGALRRRPEARWRKTPRDVPQLVALQRELLTAAYEAVAPGGVVVYSTCSPHRAETSDVVRFVAHKTGARIEDARQALPELKDTTTTAAGGEDQFIQLWPHRHGTDAMFIAVLTKPVEQ
ncbi:rRNA small subunit methyltransferase B [Corynebacterium sp. 320]|uniref:RsmB/NOP family class I SAM-dependent RNA methyltransferase n=1 Tax=Corynebacterium TaxID=1716 RepID=UPI00125CC6B3|nr:MULTISPECIES: transcription antitermination factor NusB [Corynebacterium]KAB1503688.1 rRNA small subunit methyltransferase B [Corynebacterium sp. 320]KAB1553211.1 rRNA small subunit methyltransferase B [Corynebacterium sp. 321]KAB1553570.1 rRNA small subunit methyltransferase B [Corynebacterium sp. 319]KAB3527824.1 rRNA small subunit methyltransferase B [Corynebacterium sp. 250]KAB3540687.1 rRNA small subunit methyltransferase B [Corynebacterium sp. 366]